MYEWRLELLFKYAGNDLNKWQNAIWSRMQTYDGDWGIITHIDNNRFIMDVHKKDIHINFSGKTVQFSWHELHYNFKDIEFFPILLNHLYKYFNSQNCDVYINPRSYKMLEEEYQNLDEQDQMEQRSLDEEVIESIELGLLNDDYIYGEEDLDNYSRDISYFLSELEALLSEFEFYEADHYYYYECSEYLSYEDYQNKRNHFLQNFRQSLFLQLENLFIQDDYKNADKFYENNCSEYISIEEYQQKKYLFWQKKKTSLLEELNQLLEINFLAVNDFYQNQCIPFLSQVEYQKKYKYLFSHGCKGII